MTHCAGVRAMQDVTCSSQLYATLYNFANYVEHDGKVGLYRYLNPPAISYRLQTPPDPQTHWKIAQIDIFQKNPKIRGRRQWAEPL